MFGLNLLTINYTSMNYPELLGQIREYALAYYKTHADDRLIYHDKGHTEDMVAAAMQIGNHYQLNDRDYFFCTMRSMVP